MKNYSSVTTWLIIILTIAILVAYWSVNKPAVLQVDYSTFQNKVQKHEITEVVISSDKLVGKTKEGTKIEARIPPALEVANQLRKESKDLAIKAAPKPFSEQWFGNLLPMLLVVGLLGFFWLMMMRQMQSGAGQAMNFGKSRAKLAGDHLPKVTFDDVAGLEESKEDLKEVVEFLRDQSKFTRLGAKIPKGVLLVGPPGCGKTLLARAVAGEAGVPFFYISGSDFVEMFVGVGASRVRDLFDQAKQAGSCIVFIDEIDAVGRQRGAGLGGGHDEREQTLNALLVEMDGFDPQSGIIVLAATNRPDVLDPALLRPGRFDRRVIVDAPDLHGRQEIIRLYLKDKPLADDVEPDVLARRTVGFTGADLENMVNEAALLAARANKKLIDAADFEEAIDRVVAGPERRSRVLNEKERRVVAYHEAGHALVGKLLPNAPPVHKVTILARGLSLGHTVQLPTEDRYLMSKTELLDQIASLLGGRVAEELVFGEVTTGAQNDLEKAAELARRMVTEYGMSEKVGPLTVGKKHGPVFLGRDLVEERNYSEQMAELVDQEVKEIITDAYATAETLLDAHRETLQKLAEALLERETLQAQEIDELVKEGEAVAKQAESPKPPEPVEVPVETEPAEHEAKPAPAAEKDSTPGLPNRKPGLEGGLAG